MSNSKKASNREKMNRQALMNVINEEQKRVQDAYNRRAKKVDSSAGAEQPKAVPAGQVFGLTFHANNPKKGPDQPKHVLRTMACRFGVTAGQTGEGMSYTHSDHGLIGVFEMVNQKTLLRRRLRQLTAEIAEREEKLAAEKSEKKAARQKETLAKRQTEKETLDRFDAALRCEERLLKAIPDKDARAELKKQRNEIKAELSTVLKPPYKSIKRTSIKSAAIRGRLIENTTPCPEDNE